MRLDYKILWVEDTTDWVETYTDELRDYLRSLGFLLYVTPQTRAPVTQDEIQGLKLDQYHLILMDYDLGAGKNGAEVIQQIRDLDIITEVIFYSGTPDYLERAKERPLEGVYWAARDDSFSDRVNQIINLTIRRVMDLPAMRGLAVAEIANLDHVMNDLIIYHDSKASDEQRNSFRGKMVERLAKSVEGRANKLKTNETKFLEDLELLLMDTVFMDSDKRWRAVRDVANACEVDEECKSILKEYDNLLKQRNDLAHGHSDRGDDGIERIKGKNQDYSMEDALKIRLELLKHKDNLQDLLARVKGSE
jgi:CheY-like chemotaxis protein